MMTKDELKKHPLFPYAGLKERAFLRAYIDSSGSIGAGIRAAFGQRPKNSRVSELLRSEILNELMLAVDGRDKRTEDDLERIAIEALRRATRPYEVFKGIELLRKMKASQKTQPTREDLVRRGKELDKKWRDKNV